MAAWASAASFSVACDSLLDVPPLGRVAVDSLDNPARAQLLVQGAIGDFECAFTNYVTGMAVMSDEMRAASAQAPRTWDRRSVANNTGAYAAGDCGAFSTFAMGNGYGIYTTLHIARFQADDALRRIEGFPADKVPNRDSLLATAAAYAGYSYTLFGEGFCWSTFDTSTAMAPIQVLTRAEQRFTSALTSAQRASNLDMQNMALIGRARVRLDLGDSAGAVADARLVTPGYVKNATRSVGIERRENVLYDQNYKILHITVDPKFRNLTVGGVPDPRVPTLNSVNRIATDGSTIIWHQTKYKSESDPIPIATYSEARLIVAEVVGGDTAVAIVNALRASRGLPATFASSNPIAIRDTVREERRRELFLDGHRMNDMNRWKLPLDVGASYGQVALLPLPDVEFDQNPNIPRTLDRNPGGRCLHN